MRNVLAKASGAASLPAASSAFAQYSGSMMNDGGWIMGWMGAYGGWWTPLVVVVLVVAVVALFMGLKGR